MIHKSIVQKIYLLIGCLFWAAIFGLLLRAGMAAAPEFPLLAGFIGLMLVGIACYLVRLSFR